MSTSTKLWAAAGTSRTRPGSRPTRRCRRRPTCRKPRRRGTRRRRVFAGTAGSREGDRMRKFGVLAFVASLLAAGIEAQNPAPAPTPAMPLELYQVDLVPTGTGFAVTKPVQEGDVWVFQV